MLVIKWYSRFQVAYEKESMAMQSLIQGAVHEFELRYNSDNRNFIRAYDRVEAVKSKYPIIEIKVSGGKRMIVSWNAPTLVLLDVGDHETVRMASRFNIDLAIEVATVAPDFFHLSKRSPFVRLSNLGYQPYANELLPEWHYYLDAEQNKIYDKIVYSGIKVLTGRKPYSLHYLMGGPGTGKTIILLRILQFFANDRYSIRLIISSQLQDYLQKCLPMIDLDPFINVEGDADITLVDDPSDSTLIRYYSEKAKSCKLVVIAFDPLQLNDSFSDAEFSALKRAERTTTHFMKTCYRQKENVGLATKRIAEVIAESTPYLAKEKIQDFYERHKIVTKESNDLSFPNKLGHSEVIANATFSDVIAELDRIKNHPGGMWSRADPLLVAIVDENIHELPSWLSVLLELSGTRYCLVSSKKVTTIKGLEFQHVFIVAGNSLLTELSQGFTGTGRNLYNSRRLIRIPISRAKDSIAIFGIDLQ